MLAFTDPPPARSTVADTYGVGTPGAARCTIVKLRTTPCVPNFSWWNARFPQLAQALRRSKYLAPHESHTVAARCGSPSSTTRYPTIGIWRPMRAESSCELY